MISPARVAAYDAGTAVSSRRLDLSDAVAAARRALRDDRDKTLAAEIAIGVQRWRAALDHLITHFAKRPIDRLDPEVVEILRLSAYQLLHLTRVPASAVVDDAVNLTGRAGKRSASGLVNAVLRALSRSRQGKVRLQADTTYDPYVAPDPDPHDASSPGPYDASGLSPQVASGLSAYVASGLSRILPPRPDDPADRAAALGYLSITLSHPRWLVERWYERYGFEATERWLAFNNAPAPLTLRANPIRNTRDELILKLEREDISVRRGRYAPDALIVERGHPLGAVNLDEGSFAVQDEASQLVTLLAGARPGRLLLDTCASPGGKATALAARLPEGGLLVACDVRKRRMDLLERTVTASGAQNVRLVRADLLRPLPFAGSFDCVFVDAPCSGLGTLRRDPDLKWRRQEGDLPTLAAAQITMLQHAAAAVRPGGRLIYATCSSEPEENESVAAAFLATMTEFVEVDVRNAGLMLPLEVVDLNGHLRTYPHEHGLEAFFGAVFTRKT
jgi:16S rRNA (cytosine967-C5)-methyltransferase